MASGSWKDNSVGKLGTMALPHLASRALQGIGQNHPQAWKHYLKAFKSGDIKTQKALSYGLKYIHSKELINTLIGELTAKDQKEEARLYILDILARLSHKEGKWDLKAWWGTRPRDSGPYYNGVKWEMTETNYCRH